MKDKKKRHSWIKIGHGKRQCVTCRIIKFETQASDKYNTIWQFYYPDHPTNIMNINPGCK